MLRSLMRGAAAARLLPLVQLPSRHYFPDRKLMKWRPGKYHTDPDAAAERIMRILAIHDHVKDPAKITLKSRLVDIGLNSLDLVEVCLGVEDEFNIEFTDEQCEGFRTVNDIVECTATNQFADY